MIPNKIHIIYNVVQLLRLNIRMFKFGNIVTHLFLMKFRVLVVKKNQNIFQNRFPHKTLLPSIFSKIFRKVNIFLLSNVSEPHSHSEIIIQHRVTWQPFLFPFIAPKLGFLIINQLAISDY